MELYIIIWIILIAGFLGSLPGFLKNLDLKRSCTENWVAFFAALTSGVCATITVPLFLKIVSNNLLDTGTTANYAVLAGFCILASYFSQKYLENLADKVNNLQKEAHQKDKAIRSADNKAEAAIAKVKDLSEITKNIQQDKHEIILSDAISEIKSAEVSDEQVSKFLMSLKSEGDLFRLPEKIANETGIKNEEVSRILEQLDLIGLVEKNISENKISRYKIVNNFTKILSANYGSTLKYVDVTIKIKELVNRSIFEGPVSPSFLAVADPDPGVVKILKIHCRINGIERVLAFSDGETFHIE